MKVCTLIFRVGEIKLDFDKVFDKNGEVCWAAL